MPVAVNGAAVPSGMDALAGVIAIETSVGPDTVIVVEEEIEFEATEMVAVPWPEVVARP